MPLNQRTLHLAGKVMLPAAFTASEAAIISLSVLLGIVAVAGIVLAAIAFIKPEWLGYQKK